MGKGQVMARLVSHCKDLELCLVDAQWEAIRASLVPQMVKNLSAVRETWVRFLGWEDPLEEGMATHCSILAWRIPWPRLVGYSPWGCKESHMTERLSTHTTGKLLKDF